VQPKKGMGIMIIVSPSLLSANFLNLEKDIEMFNKSNAQWLHYDVMDGNFVPNISFGPQILEQVCKITDKFIDVHIMVANPLKVVDYFDKARVNMLTFHYEAVKDLEELNAVIDKIHAKGIKAAVSIKPNTPVEVLEPVLCKLDMVLVMSVEPGFGGQKFMTEMLSKCDWLHNWRIENNLNYLIQIDGGINYENGKKAVEHHCDSLVAGSYCFNNPVSFDYAVDSLLSLKKENK
jgi:ribulose-phosphate 3-epimerase